MLLWKSLSSSELVVAPGDAGWQPSLQVGWVTSVLGSSLPPCPCRLEWGGLCMLMGGI